MIYLEANHSQELHCFQSVQLKQRLRHVQFDTRTRTHQNSFEKQLPQQVRTQGIKNSQLKKLVPFIKINKNLENAFPQNFFDSTKHYKTNGKKKQEPVHRKFQEINLQEVLPTQRHQQLVNSSFNKYQSIEIGKSTSVTSPIQMENLENYKRSNRFKIKSLKSARTSIEKKHDLTFSFEKEKFNALPQTAQTLQNIDEEELYNITFGNGFSKPSTPNKSHVDIEQNKNSQKIDGRENKRNSLRLKNVVSLQLKRNIQKTSMKKKSDKNGHTDRILYSERSGLISQRHPVLRTQKQLRSSYEQKIQKENPFLKIKFDMDQILRKKTLVLPKLNNITSNTGKRQRLSKLVKLVG